MPLLDATFRDQSGQTDKTALLQFGPSIQVIVGHFSQPGSTIVTPTDTEATFALVDTGACESCIDSALAKKLGLPVIDTMQIAGASGSNTHDVYLAYINILGLEFSQYGRFAGVHLSAGQQEHGVLLGRTFLSNVLLIYDGLRGQITLTAARLP